jgi:Concanavalin A-like lectin/glucanases superfamily
VPAELHKTLDINIRYFLKIFFNNKNKQKNMKQTKTINLAIAALFLIGLGFAGCKKNKDVPLPQIGGYNNSDEVGATNLKAYWGLEGNGTEGKSGTLPTSTVGVTYTTGVRGQAASFANGYIYFASAVGGALTSNQPFTVSAWIQASNNFLNGGNPPANNHPYQYFQMARPGQLFGDINLTYEAGAYGPASDTMFLKSLYSDAGGLQDAVNNYGIAGTEYKVVKKAGTSQWVNVVTTYNPAGGTGAQSIFRIYADSVQVNNINFENRGTNSFAYTPHEIIIGGWYNNIPGKTVSADTWTTPFTGKIDEIRIWNKLLTRDEITAIYQLGKAGR